MSFTGDLDFKTWLYILQNRFPNWADDKDNSRTNNGYKILGLSLTDVNEWKDTLCLRWYNELQDEYESFTQRENIIEEIVSKTLLFTKTGHIITESELV